MSGSPKFSEAEIAEWKQKILEAQRQRRAADEARRRREAEEEERQRQFEMSRHQLAMRVQVLLSDLHWEWGKLYIQVAVALQNRCQNQEKAIALAESETQLLEISEELVRIDLAFQEGLQLKRRNEAEKNRRVDIDRQQLELEELELKVAQVPEAEALKFDAAGRQQVLRYLQTVRFAIAVGDQVAVRRPLSEATATLQKHLRQIAQGQKNWRELQADAVRQVAELQIVLAGLKAEPVVMRWQGGALTELEAQMTGAVFQALADSRFDQAISSVTEIRKRSQTIQETANTAQIQAERRDYIAESMAMALQEMGFSITYQQPEYPDHPASAVILGATTQTGKEISVSVPIVGQVFYDVDGYAKHSIAMVDGNTHAVCDEAEQVLAEMHAALEDKFGVKMGEVLWEGKTPNRVLRQAEHLPSSQRLRNREIKG